VSERERVRAARGRSQFLHAGGRRMKVKQFAHTHVHTSTHILAPRFSTQFRWWGKRRCHEKCPYSIERDMRSANEKRRISHAGRILRGPYFLCKITPATRSVRKYLCFSFSFVYSCFSPTDRHCARPFLPAVATGAPTHPLA